MKLLRKLIHSESRRRREENKRLRVKEIDRLCRVTTTTTALTSTENLLKLLSCQIRETLESLDCSAALSEHLLYKLPAEHTQQNLSLHNGFLSHPSMYGLPWLCVNGWRWVTLEVLRPASVTPRGLDLASE